MVAILFGLLDFLESSGFFGAQSVPDAKAQWKTKGKDVFPHDNVEEVVILMMVQSPMSPNDAICMH